MVPWKTFNIHGTTKGSLNWKKKSSSDYQNIRRNCSFQNCSLKHSLWNQKQFFYTFKNEWLLKWIKINWRQHLHNLSTVQKVLYSGKRFFRSLKCSSNQENNGSLKKPIIERFLGEPKMVLLFQKLKVLYWHWWFHEESLPSKEPLKVLYSEKKVLQNIEMWFTLRRNGYFKNWPLKGSLGNQKGLFYSIKNKGFSLASWFHE